MITLIPGKTKHPGRRTPREDGIRVPTDMPSPTSPARPEAKGSGDDDNGGDNDGDGLKIKSSRHLQV